MAKLTVENRPVQKIVEEKRFVLELSLEEAVILKNLTGRVFGSGIVRKFSDGIHDTLNANADLNILETQTFSLFDSISLHDDSNKHFELLFGNK